MTEGPGSEGKLRQVQARKVIQTQAGQNDEAGLARQARLPAMPGEDYFLASPRNFIHNQTR